MPRVDEGPTHDLEAERTTCNRDDDKRELIRSPRTPQLIPRPAGPNAVTGRLMSVDAGPKTIRRNPRNAVDAVKPASLNPHLPDEPRDHKRRNHANQN